MTDRDENNKSPVVNIPRRPFIAFLLSLLTPGLGQIYNGQFKKGLCLFLALLFFPVFFGLFRLTTTFSGFTVLVFIDFSIRIFTIADAVTHARKLNLYLPLIYNKWYILFAFAIFQITILYYFDIEQRLGVATFKSTTASNAPTIKIGDCFIADLRAYDYKKVNYGDVVVFYAPGGNIETFRAVGLPFDKIQIENNELIINGKKCSTVFVNDTVIDNVIQYKYIEILPNGFKHFILKNKQSADTTISNMPTVIVPERSYFLVGDNRDNAADSRFIGPIYEDEIIGQMMFIYWSKNLKRISKDYRTSE